MVYMELTKNKEGYTPAEIEELLGKNPEADRNIFYDNLNGVTGMFKNGEMIIYHCDVETALKCAIDKRRMRGYEFD